MVEIKLNEQQKKIMEDLKKQIKIELVKQGMTMQDLIEKMNQKYDTNNSVNNISNKFRKGTIKWLEISMMADVLGLEIELKEKD